MQEPLKLAGVLLCAAGIIYFTFSLTARMRRRLRSIDRFLSALCLMRSEIQTRLSDLYDVFGMLAISSAPPLREFFESIAAAKTSPGRQMRASLEEMRAELCLGDQEYDTLCDLASSIGLYDAEAQLRDINRAIARLEDARLAAGADCSKKTKLYGTVGVSGALALVLILL